MFRRKHWKILNFTVPVQKEVARTDKKEKEITKNISYKLQFIDSARFTASSLSNFANNLSEGIHISKCKYGHDNKKCKIFVIKCKCCDCFFGYKDFKDDLTEYKCLYCNNKLSTQVWRKVKGTIF